MKKLMWLLLILPGIVLAQPTAQEVVDKLRKSISDSEIENIASIRAADDTVYYTLVLPVTKADLMTAVLKNEGITLEVYVSSIQVDYQELFCRGSRTSQPDEMVEYDFVNSGGVIVNFVFTSDLQKIMEYQFQPCD